MREHVGRVEGNCGLKKGLIITHTKTSLESKMKDFVEQRENELGRKQPVNIMTIVIFVCWT
jgi:hypothetical protein